MHICCIVIVTTVPTRCLISMDRLELSMQRLVQRLSVGTSSYLYICDIRAYNSSLTSSTGVLWIMLSAVSFCG